MAAPWALGLVGTGLGLGGAVAGFTSTAIMTGSLSKALMGGVIGALSGGLAYGIGHMGSPAFNALMKGSRYAKGIAHGLARGVVARIQGQNFKSGFLSGLVGSVAGGIVQGMQNVGFAAKVTMSAIAGGLSSVAGGGKFANGAMSAAYVYMFNHEGYEKLKAVFRVQASAGVQAGITVRAWGIKLGFMLAPARRVWDSVQGTFIDQRATITASAGKYGGEVGIITNLNNGTYSFAPSKGHAGAFSASSGDILVGVGGAAFIGGEFEANLSNAYSNTGVIIRNTGRILAVDHW